MIREIHLDVLVDDIPAVEGVLPLHGLSINLEITYSDGSGKTVLFDTGPSAKILDRNARELGVVLNPDVVFGSLPHFHHIGGLLSSLRGKPRVLPPPPLTPRKESGVRPLPGVPDVFVLQGDTYWNEQGLAVRTRRGWLVVLGCSIHGLRRTFGGVLAELGEIWGLVGGLNISTRDSVNIRFLEKISRRGLELVMPLHSVSMEARKTILEGINRFDFGYEVSGCGVQSDFSF
ncbi:MAG: hypothetical protein ABWK01_01825 [Infirmifilum sp.]